MPEKDTKVKQINISLPEATIKQLDKLAEQEQRTRSNMVMRLIMRFFACSGADK